MQPPVPMESPDCLLCGGSAFTAELDGLQDWVWRKPGQFTLQRCTACDLVMTRPRPRVPDGLGFYYEGAYSGSEDAYDAAAFYESGSGRALNRYRLVTLAKVRPLTAADHVLDVGCSWGYFLQLARQQIGCRTSGLDLDSGAIHDAKDPDQCSYYVGRLTDAPSPLPDDSAFDVITFYQCLEHDADPVSSLRAAHARLSANGIVVVEVPNYAGWWRLIFRSSWLPLLPPQHLVHFTPATLSATLDAAGFDEVHRQTMFFPTEFTPSLSIAIHRLLGLTPTKRPTGLRAVWELALKAILFLAFWLVELPSQFWLRAFGASGHMTLIGKKRP